MRTEKNPSKAMPKAMPTKSGDTDAISLLMADHENVKDMFEQFESMTDRAVVSKKKLADEICSELTKHTQVEEEIFYPAVRAAGKEFEDLIDEAVVEHGSAKQLIADIEAMDPGDDLYDAKVKVLSEMIEHHVQEEEGELFPKVRKAKLDLVELGQQMAERKDQISG
ncbi:hemerythrin domain-containing protein [Massilia sp. Root351]|jgi:hemerythrin superfamily protein|uniref:hemerythrin domain-containing protein n=1 Tax=Massilia sp. Root351 TaxID=1736522 RepID=UPI0009EC87FC|nr:hemerythrin domain-containing protein [Massilia sp. Root351]